MKNIEIVTNLQNVNTFITHEMEAKKPFVNAIAKFKLKKNLKTLQDEYKIYIETLTELKTSYGLTDDNGTVDFSKIEDEKQREQAIKELNELLKADSDIVLAKITDKDFTDDCLLGDIMLLDFMTEEVEENE